MIKSGVEGKRQGEPGADFTVLVPPRRVLRLPSRQYYVAADNVSSSYSLVTSTSTRDTSRDIVICWDVIAVRYHTFTAS